MNEICKYSVGYQLPDICRMADIIAEYRDNIEELYFPWLGMPSGRGMSIAYRDECELMMRELEEISGMGVRLNLLLNATCYGHNAISETLVEKTLSVIRELLESTGLGIVTTTSLFLAQKIKEHFPELEIRASVNIGVGTVSGIKSISAYFDSFYLKRELNRFPEAIAPLSKYCKNSGKGLYILANSGCLCDCPSHIFHDNLVSHEHELREGAENWRCFRGTCWPFFADVENRAALLHDTSWIRPEEIDLYSGLVDGIKLATRSHNYPEKVIRSYVQRSFSGNMLSLCEPDFSSVACLDNSRFPQGWMSQINNLPEDRRNESYERWFEHAYC